MSTPNFEELLEAIAILSDSALKRRPFMQDMRQWVGNVFSRIQEENIASELRKAWDRFRNEAKDKLGVELLEEEIDAVTTSCRRAVSSSRKAERKDVLNSAATLMDSIKKDVKLPPAIEIVWNAAREAVDVAKG